jgi:hypothetical protein
VDFGSFARRCHGSRDRSPVLLSERARRSELFALGQWARVRIARAAQAILTALPSRQQRSLLKWLLKSKELREEIRRFG